MLCKGAPDRRTCMEMCVASDPAGSCERIAFKSPDEDAYRAVCQQMRLHPGDDEAASYAAAATLQSLNGVSLENALMRVEAAWPAVKAARAASGDDSNLGYRLRSVGGSVKSALNMGTAPNTAARTAVWVVLGVVGVALVVGGGYYLVKKSKKAAQ